MIHISFKSGYSFLLSSITCQITHLNTSTTSISGYENIPDDIAQNAIDSILYFWRRMNEFKIAFISSCSLSSFYFGSLQSGPTVCITVFEGNPYADVITASPILRSLSNFFINSSESEITSLSYFGFFELFAMA